MLTEQTVGNARAWRMFEAIGLGAVGVTLFAVIVINLALIPPVLIFGVLYLLLGVAVGGGSTSRASRSGRQCSGSLG